MARPREFDIDTALARALDVFWEKGYDDASLPDLLEGMKLTRGSLYKAFVDKKTLYLRVLEQYDEKAVNEAVSLLTAPGTDGWVRIQELFRAITDVVEQGDRRGCLLCSAAAGPAAIDPEIGAAVASALGRMHGGFCSAIEDSSHPQNAQSLAHLLVNQYVGHRIMARAGASLDMLRQSCAALEYLRAK
ncbi:TetR family transcriptional regulator [Epibacterium sp. SM1979]|uniref:TetR family transcriptional regulator n=1 Tax=Tritonibacter litoralis TaxID=2662264 RepID=A0A843YM09_9RHOB|nr:TetR/AcrR family transcriptional regulator [Tritonibacter litoralis]MQQ10454.1 TetR family transcriptional regulator [Tritonibacter litoralis]